MKQVRSIQQLFKALGGDKAVGEALYSDSTDPHRAARNAKLRGRIGVSRWHATIRHAKARGIDLTLAQLAAWTSQTQGKP